MTIKIEENQTDFTFAVNVADMPLGNYKLTVVSQHSNEELFIAAATIIETNARYTLLIAPTTTEMWNNHWNGMHIYTLSADGITYDTGSFKLETQPGGGMGTKAHISNNEMRQAEVIYRPNY